MPRQIGYYVHHHGRGHLARALAIAQHLPHRITLLGTGLVKSSPDVPFLDLEPDYPSVPSNAAANALHYAPLNHAGIRDRIAKLSGWIAKETPGLLVCDVSVEIAMLARLTGTPFLYIRLNGKRTDAAHMDAFAAAQALIAPFHETLEDPWTPLWIRGKTKYLPGITAAQPYLSVSDKLVLVINGQGGPPFDGDAIAGAARATPDYQWQAIGAVSPPSVNPGNLEILGWVENVEAYIAKAGLIVGASGDGTVNAVIAAAKPFICLPQDRPFDEQRVCAARLEALGAAVVLPCWPQASAWPALLNRAFAIDTSRLTKLHDAQGTAKAAAFIASFAAQI